MHTPPTSRFADLRAHERRVYSQYGEDGVIEHLFRVVTPVCRHAVEIGVWWGPGLTPGAQECNTRLLRERGDWQVLQIDGAADPDHAFVRREFVTAENVGALLDAYRVPERFALLSLDVDGMDYWIWRALPARFRPQVVVIEYNAMFGDCDEAKVVPYDPEYRWDGSSWTGASLGALVGLARDKGYALVHCSESNAFFLALEHFDGEAPVDPERLYRRRWGYLAAPTRDPKGRPWHDCGTRRRLGRRVRYLVLHQLSRLSYRVFARPRA